MLLHLRGQHCVKCHKEIKPGDSYHVLPSLGRLGVDFVHSAECPICVEEEGQ